MDKTIEQQARELPFVIENRAGTMVLDWSAKGGHGCRPATDQEIQMWHLLTRPAPSDGDSYHPATHILIEGLKKLPGGQQVLREWDSARAKVDANQPEAREVKRYMDDAPLEPVSNADELGDSDYRPHCGAGVTDR